MLKTFVICTATCVLAAGCATPVSPKAPAGAAGNTAAQANCVGAPAASRIPHSGCGAGQSYTQADIQRTGQTNVAAALPMLDPAIHR